MQLLVPTRGLPTGFCIACTSVTNNQLLLLLPHPAAGYYQGASQLCAEGFWSAGSHKLPCTQCAFGTTTNFATPINSAAANCTKYVAGYGLLNDIPQLCAIGQYQPPQQDKGTACAACPASLTTSAVGGTSLAACDLCAAGYGTIAQNTTCSSCQDGYYGTSDRKDNTCTKCPGGRTFSSSQADCMADFSQTVEGAFYLDLTPGAGFTSIAGRGGRTCRAACRSAATTPTALPPPLTMPPWSAGTGALTARRASWPTEGECACCCCCWLGALMLSLCISREVDHDSWHAALFVLTAAPCLLQHMRVSQMQQCASFQSAAACLA
jgi:hypothetical protein